MLIKKAMKLTLLILLLIIPTNVKAQEVDETPVDEEINYYHNLYEEQKRYNSELVQLIYIVLTITVALILLFLGASFLFNYRLNKKELDTEINRLQKLNNETLNNLISKEKVSIDKYLSDETKKIKKMIRDELQNDNYELKREIELQRKAIKTLEYEVDIAAARYWEYKKVYNNSARHLAESLIKKIEMNRSIELSLDEFIEVLNKTSSIGSHDLKLYYDLMSKMGPEFKSKKNQIEKLLDR
ncbi:hypothetical protein [Pseudogracilibacillus auburnensis]|uniref:hypothetical protein n=1 Tax=Pseudogracilibacillus auburnensis TaxID=1494959 RepID=UPI001A9756EC|nr:hypothetical protein [Pseudogracilibacillus auburnensis]MBO1005621.1 hypothetical protein [Pseudogracilibacillus auburnensis]